MKPNINKSLYKIFLICTKYTPITLAVLYIINLYCNYCGLVVPLLMYIGGVSFMFIGLLYIMSWVFQFCYLYRIPLHYITIGNVIGILNKSLSYPIDALMMFRIYFILSGVMIVCYIWFIYKNRNNPKIDHIKQLCETYADCNV